MSDLDLSNHDYATFDPVCLKASGVDRVILGCWDFAIAEDMLLRLRAAGIVVEDVYCFLYYRLPWESNDVLNATTLAERHGGIRRIWLDCESMFDGPAGYLDTEAEGTTVADRVALTQAYWTTLSREYQVGIYTGLYWWLANMNNTTWFAQAGAPLWFANYGLNNPDAPRDPIAFVDFGGWHSVAIHQYSSTIPVCGRARDHNYWLMEDTDMDEDLRRAIFAGNEEGDKTPSERLALANYRISTRQNGGTDGTVHPSLAEVVYSLVGAVQALAAKVETLVVEAGSPADDITELVARLVDVGEKLKAAGEAATGGTP